MRRLVYTTANINFSQIQLIQIIKYQYKLYQTGQITKLELDTIVNDMMAVIMINALDIVDNDVLDFIKLTKEDILKNDYYALRPI